MSVLSWDLLEIVEIWQPYLELLVEIQYCVIKDRYCHLVLDRLKKKNHLFTLDPKCIFKNNNAREVEGQVL